MALDVETGTFTKDNSGTDGATDVVSTSFQPKALIIWGVLQQVADSENGGDASHSLGFSDGTNSRCVDVRSEDAIARSDYLRVSNNDAVLGFLDPAGTGFLAKASVVFNASDFTVTWNLNNTDASRIHYIIYGGSDITGVQVGDFVKTTAAQPANQSITTDADVQNITPGEGIVFFLHARRNAFNITTNDIFTQLGAASDTTEEAVFAAGGDDNDAVGQPFLFNLDDACIIGTGTASGGINYEGEFNGFDALGFDINFRLNDGVTDIISFMIIKGGKWEVGTETAGTATGNKVTTTGHQPKGLLVIGNKQTVTGFSQGIDQSYNIGASDATTETSGAWTDQDGAIDMIVGGSSSITKLARILNALNTPTVDGEANVASFNALDFTLDWTNAASAAFRFMWVIAGDGVAATVETKTFTLDAVLKKEDITKTFTLDAVLEKVFTKTFTLDAVLEKVFTKTFTLDAVLEKVFTKTFTLDAVLKKLAVTKTFTLDAVLKILAVTKTFTLDAVLSVLASKTFTLDAVLLKVFTKTFTLDAVLKKLGITKTFTLDAVLEKIFTKTFTLDAVLKKLAITKTFTLDAVLEKVFTKTFTIDAVLKKLGITKTFTLDAVLEKVFTKTFTLDAFLEAAPVVIPGSDVKKNILTEMPYKTIPKHMVRTKQAVRAPIPVEIKLEINGPLLAKLTTKLELSGKLREALSTSLKIGSNITETIKTSLGVVSNLDAQVVKDLAVEGKQNHKNYIKMLQEYLKLTDVEED